MLYVYCEKPSTSVMGLVKVLEGKRLRQFDGMDFWDKKKKVELSPGDIVICWGASIPELDGIRVLNARPSRLSTSNIRKILGDWSIPMIRRYNQDPRSTAWIGRLNGHKNGEDLLNPPDRPDYWEEKVGLVHEYRVHSFDKRSIRAGVKVPREGMNPHPWIRTWETGWKIDYVEFESTKELRALAHKVIGCLGLTFGAVDIGELASGGRIVLGVDTGPILTDVTEGPYLKAIQKWIANDREKDKDDAKSDMEAFISAAKAMSPWKDPFEELDRFGPPRPRQIRPSDDQPTVSRGRSGRGSGVFSVQMPPLPVAPRPNRGSVVRPVRASTMRSQFDETMRIDSSRLYREFVSEQVPTVSAPPPEQPDPPSIDYWVLDEPQPLQFTPAQLNFMNEEEERENEVR